MSEVSVGILGLIVLFFLFATGIELGFAMALVGFAGFVYLKTFHSALNLVGTNMFEMLGSYAFTMLPLFILMGQIGFLAGLAARLFDSAHKFVGHMPGGLAQATVVGATAFKAISGSTPATTATFSAVAIPEMDRYGYDKRLSTGIVACVGTLGAIMPPSAILIIIGIITEQSIGKLFLAGIVPGFLIIFFFVCIIYAWTKINPGIAPRSSSAPWKERWNTLLPVVWVLAVFIVVVGGITGGFFTPTEAGAVGTFAVLLGTIFTKDMTFKTYVKSVGASLRLAVMIMMLIIGSVILGKFITVTNIPQIAADWIVTLRLNHNIIMILICLVYLIGGSFIDDLAFMMLATPIFYPAVIKLGFDPIWFGIIIGVVFMIGVVIPPVALSVFIVQNVTKVPLGTIYKGVTPFLVALVLSGVLLFIFPELALWLPSLFMGK